MFRYWRLSAWTEYVNCPAGCIILPHPRGKMIKTQLFGKHHFKGFCENFVFLILPRICSQKIKGSESKLINCSIFMVSPPESQDKRWLTLPHFTLLKGSSSLLGERFVSARYVSTHSIGKERMLGACDLHPYLY